MSDAFVFKESAFRRTAKVVRIVEKWSKDKPPPNPPNADPPPDNSDGEQVRLGTISATWSKGATATVTQLKGGGGSQSRTITFTAYNWFATVPVSGGTKKVACGKVGDTWILIAAEC